MNPPAYKTLLLERRGTVTRLTLNRPERLNAMSAELMVEMLSALEAIAADPAARCLVITGTGRGFCAGADLAGGTVEAGESDLSRVLHEWYHPVVRRLADFPLPVVCAVNGMAAGGGMSLALAADITIAARSAQFLQAFCNIGLVPDVGSTWFLPRSGGTARALGLALLGQRISAEEAARQGLIWACVADADLDKEATALAERLAAGSSAALVATRRLLRGGWTTSLDEQLEAEGRAQREAGRRPDFAEGVAAFREKRAPAFRR